MSDQPKLRIFTITIAGEDDDVPVIVRLRSWLKTGKRQFRLRCVSAHELEAQKTEGPGQQDNKEFLHD